MCMTNVEIPRWVQLGSPPTNIVASEHFLAVMSCPNTNRDFGAVIYRVLFMMNF